MIISDKQTIHKVTDLSKHLFWDVVQSEQDWYSNAKFIVQRVLELGVDRDWQILKSVYGLDEILTIAKSIPTLDDISSNFIAIITDTKITEFKCYELRQSVPNYSGF